MTNIISRETVFAGRVLDVGVEQHQLPNGILSSFEIIRHPGGAAILPVLSDGRLLLIRQFRPAIGQMVYEIPAGRLEPGESALECAGRELVEETGYSAAKILPLGCLWSAVGFCDELIHLFVGHDLCAVGQNLEPDEVVELNPLTLMDALHKIMSNEILDSKTQLALLRYQMLGEENNL